ncbi:hypothetical protein AB0395_02270 [Streptosporangium sp. NPDC051023]|uniref:hypothetical protein n=1 Tax=Streptosporangium sp. NPDC051023 TaxID=3155410 RepID=UPI00344B23FD
MTEFVGIDPAGARRLIGSMGDAVQRVRTLRPFLAASIAEAGPDWPSGPGAEVLDRVGRFLEEVQRDLTWRTQVIERVEGAAVPAGGVKTARFAFRDASSAQLAGTLAGARIRAAWQDYEADPGVAAWERAQATLRDGQDKTTDPAYSTAMLSSLGTTTFGAILTAVGKHEGSDRYGYDPAGMEKARKDLGPLVGAFASADAAGTLPAGLRKHVLGELSIGGMAALLGLARQSHGFLVQAGTKLAQYARHRDDEEDWNTYWLVKALSQDGEATQELLAAGDNAALLLRSEVVGDEGRPAFKELLATALDKALASGVGDAAHRRNAWINVIKVFSDKSSWPSLLSEPDKREFKPYPSKQVGRTPAGRWVTTPVPSLIGQVLARHVSQYFPELAAIWSKKKEFLSYTSTAGWGRLETDEVVSFFGGLLRDPAALPVLRKEYEVFVKGVDLGKEHPFGSSVSEGERERQRAVFLDKAGSAAGMASLLIGGLSEADLDAEEQRKFLNELFTFPLDVLVGVGTAKFLEETVLETSETVAAAVGKTMDLMGKNALKDQIEAIWDGAPPEEASELARSLLDRQMEMFEASWAQHGHAPLGDSDIAYLKTTFGGFLLPVILDALKKRNG